MEFIKVFADDASYKSYRDGKGYVKPNVSLSRDSKKVYYNVDANGHDYEDLGLPSGTLWATCNIGASEATDAGLYFQWGDTSGYTASKVGTDKQFHWNDYKWNPLGDGSTFTKYTTPGVTLELEDDAANVKMGGDWHMPSPEQINELLDNTTSFWVKTGDGLGGRHFRSIKDSSKSIFIPAAGYAYNGSVVGVGDDGNVWSSTGNASYGQALGFDSDRIYLNYDDDRCYGFPVRGVLG